LSAGELFEKGGPPSGKKRRKKKDYSRIWGEVTTFF